MLAFNPLSSRDFSAGLQAFRKEHGHHGRPAVVPSSPSISVETVQSSLSIAYERMQSVLQSRMQTVGAPAASASVENAPEDYSPQSVADRIVGFVADRLTQAREAGASDEELQALYQQALQGVEKGLREGKDIIQSQGLFADEVKDTFYDTVNRIADGLESLGESLFGEIPDASTGAVAESGAAAALSQVEMARTRSFEMEVMTQDGDRVTIKVNSGQAFSAQSAQYADDTLSVAAFEGSFSSFDNLSFSVEGDLSEDELAALNDLFGQVNDVAETFYGGNLEQAFEQAMGVGMDAEQLARFSVNLHQTETVAVRSTYAAVQNMAGPVRTNPFDDLFQRLGDFASQVQQSAEAVSQIQSRIDNLQSLYADLLGRLPSRQADTAAGDSDFQRFINRLVG